MIKEKEACMQKVQKEKAFIHVIKVESSIIPIPLIYFPFTMANIK